MRPSRVSAAVAIAGLALSGCGVADDTLRPGLAAEVGDTEIELERVDDTAADLCDMVDFLAEQDAAPTTAGAVVRDNTLQYVVLREMGEQLAAEYDVEAGEVYRGALAQHESQLTGLGVDEELVAEVAPTLSSGEFFLDVVQQIGRSELGLTADEDPAAEGITEGLRIAREWEAEHGLEVNPRYSDMSIGDLESIIETEVRDLSVPVSDAAQQALEGVDPEDPDTSYADSLPESQRCG